MNFLLCFLVCAARSAIYYKISTLTPNVLTSSDYLTSAMGGFRLTLTAQRCQLQIQKFQKNNYVVVGYFPRAASTPCQNLTISNNSLVSSSGNILLSLRSGQRNARFDQVFVTIDENSIVRISGIYFNQYQTSENWISIFRAPQQFVYSISNLSVTRFNSLSFIQNLGNWGFSATNGELRIFRVDNPTKIVRYNYTAFTMTPGNLFDYNSNSLPYADFRDFQYKSKCINSQNFAFQGPFTFSINPYWPELRLIDQNGYDIISIRYPSINCTAIGLDYTRQTTNCLPWFCPQNMFEHLGSCVATCPPPYFHQLDQDNVHRCVLNCRADFQKDSRIRVCSCTNPKLYQCPPTLQATPLGCLCPNKTFFNPTNKAKSNPNLCQSDCGPAFISHASGLCLPCPKHCIECSLSSTSFNYLRCSTCQQGFQANSEGYCVRECHLSPGKVMLNGTCQDCGVPFCRNCSSGVNNCTACYIPYSLLLNMCVDNCPSGYRSVFRSDQTFECKLIRSCPGELVQVGSVNNQSECFCIRNSRLPARTTFNQCGSQSPPCLYDQYYDPNTKECLSCPASCLTCGLDGSNRIECTSCRPDYTMFVTLAKNHYCQRNSILSFCPSNYNRQEQICSLSNLRNLVANLSNRNMCFSRISNCMICILGSNRSCSLCQQGYYLHEGQCHKECPNATYPYAYQRVCVRKMLQNCLEEREESSYWQFRKDNANQNADALLILLSVNFQLIDPLNDPIGSLFTYSARSAPRSQFPARMVNIAYSYSQCLVCQEGYGISSNGSCSPCLQPCVSCIISSGNLSSCIKCDQYHRLVNTSCVQLDPTEMPCQPGQFRNQKLICQNECLNFYRPNFYMVSKNKTAEVNCSLNCPTQYAITPKDSSPLVSCQATDEEGSSISLVKLFGSKITINNQNIYAFITSHRMRNLTKDMIKVIVLERKERILQTNGNSELEIVTTDFGFIIIENNTKNGNKPVVIQLSTAQMRATDGASFLGNSIYGYHRDVKAPIDIIFQETSNLYMYGRAFTVLLFLATVVFAGMHLNYKTDNIFTSFATAYLVLTALNLTPSASTFNCYSFLYGFAWSTYLEMLSNPRDLSQASGWFDHYLDQANNNAHYVLFVDNNIIRNCWSILLFLIIATGVLGLAILVFKCFSVKRNGCGLRYGPAFLKNILQQWRGIGYSARDFDHTTSAFIILIFFIQNSFMALTYYSFINILNRPWEMASEDKLSSFKAVSWIFIILMLFYSILRTYSNRIAGIYCLKRMVIGLILGIASVRGGIDDNIVFCIIMLVVQELAFLGLRYRYELISDRVNQLAAKQFNLQSKKATKPKINSRKTLPQHNVLKAAENVLQSESLGQQMTVQESEKQKLVYMLVEEGLIMVLYIFLVLVNVLKEGSLAVIWLIMLLFMGVVALEVFEASLKAWEAAIALQMHKSKPQPSYIKHIRNVYDHDLSLKSLAETTDN